MAVRPPCGHRCNIEIGLSGYWIGLTGSEFAAMRANGLNDIHFEFQRRMTEVEGGANPYNWATANTLASLAVDAGLTVIARLGGRTDIETGATNEPDHAGEEDFYFDDDWADEDYGWNVKALAHIETAMEQLPDVHYFQIENEPQGTFFGDNPHYYPYTGANWARYHELLKREAAIIRAADPTAVIIGPGLADVASDSVVMQNDQIAWVDRYAYRLSLADEVLPFDIFAFHLWGLQYDPKWHNEWRHPYRGLAHKIRTFDSIFKQRGLSVDEIWITEGSKTIYPNNGGYLARKGPTDQQNFLIDCVAEARQTDQCTKYFWFGWKGTSPNSNYHLIYDGVPNPVYTTFMEYCQKYNRSS